MNRPPGDIWVFAYGSLMWQPNFNYAETRPALLRGYHRALCIYSIEYRGTYETPGLVFGLDDGGSCQGIAFRVLEKDADHVIHYLHEREMVTGVYRPHWHEIEVNDGARTDKVTSYIFIADTAHKQYSGKLSDEDTVKLVLQGHGKSGPCIDYLRNTLGHLQDLGIYDETLTRIVAKSEQGLK